MAVRNDISIDWNVSPRIVTVAAPSTELSIQDLVDTLRFNEEILYNLTHEHLVNAAGKESLGGGVLVGITATLVNTKIAFEARTTPVSEGTATSNDVTGKILIDAAATFLADGVVAGATLLNYTDGSLSTVRSVDSEIQITHDTLTSGSNNDWTIGDVYDIFNIVTCSISGGNLVAVDDSDVNMSPVFPTVYTQITLTSSSSATLQEMEAIQYSSYQNAVWINTATSHTGTSYPIGTREFPVNNVQDAAIICDEKGFSTLQVIGDLTLGAGDNVENKEIVGQNIIHSHLTVLDAALTQNCEVKECTVSGILDGGVVLRLCKLNDVIYINGVVYECVIAGILTLGGNIEAYLFDCYSSIPGITVSVIDCGGSGQALSIKNYNGSIKLTNKSGTDAVSIDMNTGYVEIDSTVTNGHIEVRGIAQIVDNSTGLADVNHTYLLEGNQIQTVYETSQYSAFKVGVTIDIINGNSGTEYPMGTQEYPVNNMTDAIIIANGKGLDTFNIKGDLSLLSAYDVEGFIFIGESPSKTIITIDSLALTSRCEFKECAITGVLDGNTVLEHCLIENLTYVNGEIRNCRLEGPIYLDGNANALFLNCGGVNPGVPPVVDMGGSGQSCIFHDYSGGLKFTNMTGANQIRVQLDGGKVELDSTIAAGNVTLVGVGLLNDNSTGTTVVTNALVNTLTVAHAVWDSNLIDYTIDGTAGSSVNDISYIEKWIYINTEAGVNGNGKESSPFNNISDAIDFAELNGWRKLIFLADATLERTLKNFTIEGIGLPTIDLNNQNVDRSEFVKVKLSGQQVGSITAREVILMDGITGINGVYKESGIMGNITLADNSITNIVSASTLFSTTSVINSVDTGIGNTNVLLGIRKYSGRLVIKNVNHIDKYITTEFSGGRIELESSNTAGTIRIAGLPDTAITDNSDGTNVVVEGVFPGAQTITNSVWDETAADHETDGSAGFYLEIIKKMVYNKVDKSGEIITIFADNGTDIWNTFDLTDDGRIKQ